MLSREVLKEEEREEEAEGMLRFDDNKLPSRALLVFSPDPELGLIRRKLEDVEEGLAPPPDSSSLLLAEPPSPDLRKDPEPPPGRHDIVWYFIYYINRSSVLSQTITAVLWLCLLLRR